MVKRITLPLFLVLSLCSLQAWALEINASLSSSEVMEGDTVKLTVSIDQTADDKEPDFSALEQQFEILNTYKQERSNIVNGRFSSTTSWVLSLMPRQLGYLAIPPISYEGAETAPLKLHVAKRTAANQTDQYLFVDASLDRKEAYVQEQVLYTVRIYRYNVDIYDPSYAPPKIENAAMEQLGDQRTYKTTLDGRQYDVFEFRYAIFPQKSGTLTIPAAQLNATVFRGGNRPRGFGFDPFNGKQVRRQSPVMELDVKSIPAEYPTDKPWLPARSLSLSESWSPDTGKAQAGDPVTRTVTLQAQGVLGTILPALPTPTLDGVKIYPEPAETNSEASDNGMTGTRKESQALIATSAGNYQLPPVSVTWWDVDEQKVKVSTLPAHSLQVTGSASRPQMDNATPQTTAPTAGSGDLPPPTLGQPDSVNRTWQWIAIAALGLWLITLIALLWVLLGRNHNRTPATDERQQPHFSAALLSQAKRTLHSACKEHNPKAARIALIEYYRQQRHNSAIHNLDDILTIADSDAIAAAIRKLDSCLYRDQGQAWEGASLWNAVNQSKLSAAEQTDKSALAPLHPN